MTSRCIFFLFMLLLTFSCEEKKSDFSFVPINSEKPIFVSEIGESLDIIEIKTQYPISGVPTILKSDRYFYLFEEGFVTSLHQIDLKGNLKNSIDFGYDDKINADGITQVILRENEVGVVSMGKTVIWFDENLEELETEELPFKANFHYPLDKDKIISFNNRIDELEDYDILIKENQDIKKALPIRNEEYNFVYKSYSPFSHWGNYVLFSQAFNDTVYVWDREEFRPLFHVNFGSDAVLDRLTQIQHAMEMLAFLNEKKILVLTRRSSWVKFRENSFSVQ
ncbi:6-bladed beta-propeller [Algoriphagus hitonicola]|uniref:6-bladed beta-propeller protein n=1 Tax=Algoriphagus hitonicola TaxID=435880 RepID=A0A1I2USB0_9BACT|nr:6-bladed beta-propeller [Algoriphagus hitonicola]SFG77836.1 hypothetical protein SAMN04487988_1089 [Algoriphagus hitonicola]